MDAAVERYLQALVARSRAVLGRQLVGAYAGGSVALGAYQPGRSDVDVALVCASGLTPDAKRELVRRLRHEALACPARGLELVVYQRQVAGSGTTGPGFELELDSGSGMPFRATLDPRDRPVADGLFWYGLDRSVLHQDGLALAGPPAAQVFADLSPADLRDLLVTSLRWWLGQHPPGDDPAPGAEDAVLGACRALVRQRWGRWVAKVDAGRWLLAAGLGPADLLERSIAARSGGPPPSGARARRFQEEVLREIAGRDVPATVRP